MAIGLGQILFLVLTIKQVWVLFNNKVMYALKFEKKYKWYRFIKCSVFVTPFWPIDAHMNLEGYSKFTQHFVSQM